jgi:antitoxin (DNA-binding transcriptional repressor) of toxin-antitoxin stability system
MKTTTVRDLRNRFPGVAAWMTEGEPVEITRGGKFFARLVPATLGPPLGSEPYPAAQRDH